MTLNWVRVCLLTLACPLFLILLQVKLALCADTIDERWLALLHYEKTYTENMKVRLRIHIFLLRPMAVLSQSLSTKLSMIRY